VSARQPRDITLAEIEQHFELASYWFGTKWCPAVHCTERGYGIRVIKAHSFNRENRSYTYDYFEMDADGVVTTAPRGYAKVFKPGRVVDIEAIAARYEAPQSSARTPPRATTTSTPTPASACPA
jgi:hypothetical protein